MKRRLRSWFTLALLTFVGISFANTTLDAFDECQDIAPDEIRTEINRLMQDLFETQFQDLNLERVVLNHWSRVGMDEIIRTEVADGVELVRADTTYWQRLRSNWSSGHAMEMAERVTEYAFGAEAFRQGIERLSEEVAQDITRRFEQTINHSALEAAMCLQEFITGTYGHSALRVFEEHVVFVTTYLDPVEATDGISVGLTPTAITGLGVGTIIGGHVARRVMQNVSTRISQRIGGRMLARVAGRVGTSAVPVVGWAVGIIMIAGDLFGGMEGALNTIQQQLTSEETQAEIRGEIVAILEQELPMARVSIARQVADEVYFQWRDFTTNFRRVLATADESPAFRQFLGEVTTADFQRLGELAGIVGEDGLLETFNEGTLVRTLQLPEESVDILYASGSIPTTLAWWDVARTNLAEVVRHDIYRHKQPDDFTADSLSRLIRVNNPMTISKLILLAPEDMNPALALSVANLNALGERISAEDFRYLSWYLTRLEQGPSNVLISSWVSTPESVSRFKSEAVQDGIIASNNRSQAIQFVAAEPSRRSIYGDLARVATGDISRGLFFSQRRLGETVLWIAVLLAGIIALIAVVTLLFRWVLAPPKESVAMAAPRAPSVKRADDRRYVMGHSDESEDRDVAGSPRALNHENEVGSKDELGKREGTSTDTDDDEPKNSSKED